GCREPQQILAGRSVTAGAAATLELRRRVGVFGKQRGETLAERLRVGVPIEQIQLTRRLEQPLVLVLTVDLNEHVAQPLEEPDRHRGVVHEGAMPAAARELAANDDL